MRPNQKTNSHKFWDRVSRPFGNPNRKMNSPALQIISENLDKYFSPTYSVLDFGCGPGDITFEIARTAKEVIGIDFSQGMIDAAQQKAKGKGLDNVTFLQGNLLDSNFQDHSFDVITAFNVLQYIPNKTELYKKIQALLTSQGLFISSTACLRERLSPTRILLSGLTSLRIAPKMIFYKRSELEGEIQNAGFTIIESTDIATLPERFIVARKG